MVFQNDILAGSSGTPVSSVYKIDQSIRFNDDDSAYMSKSISSTSSRTTWTFSTWFKLGNSGINLSFNGLFSAVWNSSNFVNIALSNSSYGIDFLFYGSGSTLGRLNATRLLRDPSAWYHLVAVFDSTNAVASERMRLYINGVRETSFTTESYPSKDSTPIVNYATATHNLGRVYNAGTYSGYYYDGYMAEIHFLDGYAYDPSYFGLFNENGIWIPKEYSGSYGTNGFYFKGESASDLGNDSSGNNNDYTTSGLASHDQVLDTPTNNWCVMNPLNGDGGTTWKNGNLELSTANQGNNASSIFMTTGKWYWEVKGQGYAGGVCSIDRGAYNSGMTPSGSDSIGYYSNGTIYWGGGSDSTPASYASSDIIGVAVNMDDGEISFYKNNTLQVTLTFASTVSSLATDGCYAVVNNGTSSTTYVFYLNFGQDGTFAGTETAQGNSDGNGVGNFYYTPPTGYLALCTKNLGS
tara:strand:- start:45 stop:1442 length:1398 start_codon:yes stop_codon:yes gene_type:complete